MDGFDALDLSLHRCWCAVPERPGVYIGLFASPGRVSRPGRCQRNATDVTAVDGGRETCFSHDRTLLIACFMVAVHKCLEPC